MSNKIYIAVSLDGYIADKNSSVDWLNAVPMDDESQSNFNNFMDSIDCLVMGRNTFDTVKGFGGDWPYSKKVFVVSNSMKTIPNEYEDKIELINGNPTDIVKSLNNKGYNDLYIDGGKTIQNFLEEDLIDEMIIATIPILLGGGKSLFGELTTSKEFQLIDTKVVSDMYTQTHYKRKN
ncbi:dihydrofolate reductase family protein [Desulfovibrio inopinatus]|uniref:dihydrofolate reductase family protein n=1 Tax=Desulfovibrio inopinatus TaxID=102109 RepID=UPI0004857221|nr:dihydrofolate reductase family protein [Desulfovibrio inopinatus]